MQGHSFFIPPMIPPTPGTSPHNPIIAQCTTPPYLRVLPQFPLYMVPFSQRIKASLSHVASVALNQQQIVHDNICLQVRQLLHRSHLASRTLLCSATLSPLPSRPQKHATPLLRTFAGLPSHLTTRYHKAGHHALSNAKGSPPCHFL